MEKRDSMIFYRSFYEAIKELSKEQQGEIYNAIFSYGLDFLEPELKGISKTIWTLIKPQIDANIKRYNNGKVEKTKRNKSETEAKQKQELSEKKANVNVNVNVNENLNVNNNKKDKFSFRSALLLYGFNENLVDEWLQVRKAKKAVNTETAFKGFITEIRKSNLPINKILEICVTSSWSGFKNEYLTNKNLNNGNNGNKQQTADERLQEAKSRILGEDSEFSESKPNNENIEFTSFENVGNF
jgi:hypothetical protein